MAEDDDQGGYRWESEYERTWEAIREDESGNLQASVQDYVHKTRRQHMLLQKNVRLGMMRHLFVVLDMSQCMNENDLKPTRLQCCVELLEEFVEKFYDENPISQLGLVATCNKRAEKVNELSGNPMKHKEALEKIRDRLPVGEPSLQNSIEMCAGILKHMPSHSSREMLIIFGSLTSCDPTDINATIENAMSLGIRCSVIGLAAEVYICRQLTKVTGGSYNVVMDEDHLRELLSAHIVPPPAQNNVECSLVRMGFPFHKADNEDTPSLCQCHVESKSGEALTTGGYLCPQCKSKYCDLPVECKCCGLTLVSAPHLARSYHHLFPLDNFSEHHLAKDEKRQCFSCMDEIQSQNVYHCADCRNTFCLDCDIFIHSTLHVCPGCSCAPQLQN